MSKSLYKVQILIIIVGFIESHFFIQLDNKTVFQNTKNDFMIYALTTIFPRLEVPD